MFDNANAELARLLAELAAPPAELDRLLAELGGDLGVLPVDAAPDDDPLLIEAAAALGLF